MTDLWKQRKVNKKSFKNLKRKRFAKQNPYIVIAHSGWRWHLHYASGRYTEFHHEVCDRDIRLRTYRKIRTRQELRFSQLTEDELFYGVTVRGKRRNVPTYFDDVCVGFPHNTKNWKLISKRRKQWVPK